MGSGGRVRSRDGEPTVSCICACCQIGDMLDQLPDLGFGAPRQLLLASFATDAERARLPLAAGVAWLRHGIPKISINRMRLHLAQRPRHQVRPIPVPPREERLHQLRCWGGERRAA
eukprot:3479049-Prymnesium_polylepis.1